MSRCEDKQRWRWADVKMSRCEDEQIWRWVDLKISRCGDQQIWRWAAVKMSRYEDEQMWSWANVKISRCEDEQLWRCAAEEISRCEGQPLWRWADVTMSRCEDKQMWRWEAVKMRRCDDEKVWAMVWRWEGVKIRRWNTDRHYWKNPALRLSPEKSPGIFVIMLPRHACSPDWGYDHVRNCCDRICKKALGDQLEGNVLGTVLHDHDAREGPYLGSQVRSPWKGSNWKPPGQDQNGPAEIGYLRRQNQIGTPTSTTATLYSPDTGDCPDAWPVEHEVLLASPIVLATKAWPAHLTPSIQTWKPKFPLKTYHLQGLCMSMLIAFNYWIVNASSHSLDGQIQQTLLYNFRKIHG